MSSTPDRSSSSLESKSGSGSGSGSGSESDHASSLRHVTETTAVRPEVPAQFQPLPTGSAFEAATMLDPSSITTFARALAFLQAHVDLERVPLFAGAKKHFKLDRMFTLLDAMGNPQEGLRCVHIAGTKGKGSTVAMLVAAARAMNPALRVGAYTSPHLVDVRERIAINGELISGEEFTRAARAVAIAARKAFGGEPLHFFELLTAMAFQHFAAAEVDLAMIEVGLGGRLDSTNVITPAVSIITSISYDHMQVLGNTLGEIAGEKAGILKPGVPAVSTMQDPEAERVIRQRAHEVGAPLEVLGAEIPLHLFGDAHEGSRTQEPTSKRSVWTLQLNDTVLHLADWTTGRHQVQNAAAALAAVQVLGRRHPELHLPSGVTPEVIEAVRSVRVPGRLDVLARDTREVLVADGAHNRASIEALLDALPSAFPHARLDLIFGCAVEKDVEGMLQAIASSPVPIDRLILTRTADNPKAAWPADLAARFPAVHPSVGDVLQVRNLPDAIDLTRDRRSAAPAAAARGNAAALPASAEGPGSAGAGDHLIVITGSFYLAGEAIRLFRGPRPMSG